MLLIPHANNRWTEKDLFSFAAWKRAGAHESASRKLMRSLSELNRRYRGWEGMYFEFRE
jgi:hypothetical protein